MPNGDAKRRNVHAKEANAIHVEPKTTVSRFAELRLQFCSASFDSLMRQLGAYKCQKTVR
jgi:hypothetical protein